MRRIARSRCQKTASTWTRADLFPSSFEDFLDLRDDEEDDLPEPEMPRTVEARMKIVNEMLRQRCMSGRCCEYSAASDNGDERSFETAGAILFAVLSCPDGGGPVSSVK
jgi:hypothetical protein